MQFWNSDIKLEEVGSVVPQSSVIEVCPYFDNACADNATNSAPSEEQPAPLTSSLEQLPMTLHNDKLPGTSPLKHTLKSSPPEQYPVTSPPATPAQSRGRREHPGAKHACDVCGRSFTEKFTLRRHLSSIHGVGDVKTFPCGTCSKVFKYKHHLKAHMKKKH